jgi:hypothetical protein
VNGPPFGKVDHVEKAQIRAIRLVAGNPFVIVDQVAGAAPQGSSGNMGRRIEPLAPSARSM